MKEKSKETEKHIGRKGLEWVLLQRSFKFTDLLLFCIYLIKSLTLWRLLVAPLALKMMPNSLRGSRKFASANLCPPPVSYHSFSHQTPHSYIHSTLSCSVMCDSPEYPPSLSSPSTCLEHLSPSAYLANLHSLGSKLENASFLIPGLRGLIGACPAPSRGSVTLHSICSLLGLAPLFSHQQGNSEKAVPCSALRPGPVHAQVRVW